MKENSDKVAAMIIEPLVQAAAGMLMQPKGYIKGVRELTEKYNVLLIIDEVATGFLLVPGNYLPVRMKVSVRI